MTGVDLIHISGHAMDRWLERFPGEDLRAALVRACYVSWSRLANEASRKGVKNRFDDGADHYRDPITGAVFVCVGKYDKLAVVTVVRFTPQGGEDETADEGEGGLACEGREEAGRGRRVRPAGGVGEPVRRRRVVHLRLPGGVDD